jgi:hypothetical protein
MVLALAECSTEATRRLRPPPRAWQILCVSCPPSMPLGRGHEPPPHSIPHAPLTGQAGSDNLFARYATAGSHSTPSSSRPSAAPAGVRIAIR